MSNQESKALIAKQLTLWTEMYNREIKDALGKTYFDVLGGLHPEALKFAFDQLNLTWTGYNPPKPAEIYELAIVQERLIRDKKVESGELKLIPEKGDTEEPEISTLWYLGGRRHGIVIPCSKYGFKTMKNISELWNKKVSLTNYYRQCIKDSREHNLPTDEFELLLKQAIAKERASFENA